MFSVASFKLLTRILLTLSITGPPVEVHSSRITLPITRRIKSFNGTNHVQRDGANIMLSSIQLVACAMVAVGTSLQEYNLIVDTGSAITWIGTDSEHPYYPTDSAYNTGRAIKDIFRSGSFTGILWTDTITFDNGLTVTKMPIGVVSEAEGMDTEADGILGIGPKILSLGALEDAPTQTLSTITDRLAFQGEIPQRLVSLYFVPSSENMDDGGTLTFGDDLTDQAEYGIGNVAYTTITAMPSLSGAWAIDQSVTYDNTEILSTTAGVVDSGTALIYLPSDAFRRYKAATGADEDPRTGLLTLTPEKYSALQPLHFHIGDQTYSLSPNAQIWPRRHNDFIDGSVENGIYLVIVDRSRSTDSEDFVLGYVFLRRFYSVYDVTNSRVGFSTTMWTDADTN